MSPRSNARIDIPGLDAAKAKRYSRTRLGVLVASVVWSVARLAWFASDRRAARLKTAIAARVGVPGLRTPAFVAVVMALSWLSGLPAAFLGSYVVERRFGLTRQTPRGWFADQAKGLVLGAVLQIPLISAAYVVIRRRPRDWWLVVAGVSAPLAVLLSSVAPTLLMPLFNAFVPLRRDDLRERIRMLSERAGVRISDIYEMDMSRQSEKPNAMFTGVGNSKRIVLGDTLLERFAPDEIEAVVAHELGHQVHGDIWRLIAFGAGTAFGVLWLLSRLAPWTLRRSAGRTGVRDIGDAGSLPILALLMTAFGFALTPVQAAFSRAMERRADRFALELTRDGAAYARAMERLASLALADPDPPRPIVLMLYSHPPIADRIRVAREAERRFRWTAQSPKPAT